MKSTLNLLKNTPSFIRHYRLPLLSGLMIGTTYIPFPPWALFFCFVPLWLHWLKSKSWRDAFVAGWITNFVLSVIGFYWVVVVAHEHGGLSLPISVLALLLFASFHSYYLPVAGALLVFILKKYKPNETLSLIIVALVTIICEEFLTSIFPWHFGYTWIWAGFPAYHLGEFLGFQGLSGISIFLNVFFLLSWKLRAQKKARWFAPAAWAVGFFVLLNLLGLLDAILLKRPDDSAKVLVVQANIGNQEKLAAQMGTGFRQEIVSRFTELASSAIADHSHDIDFMVWPETAFPFRIGDHLLYRPPIQELRSWVQSMKVPLVSGVYYEDPTTKRISNGIYIVGRDGMPTDRVYKKTKLLAFGEYIPGSEFFPSIEKYFPEVANFDRGVGGEAKNLDRFRLGPQVCYESLYPQFTVEAANSGANILINVTNDSWYGPYSEPYQHLYMTLARAIEVRRPLVRATNTGISTVILADGTILRKSPLYQPWTHVYEVPFLREPATTFFQKFPWLMTLLWICLLIFSLGKAIRD